MVQNIVEIDSQIIGHPCFKPILRSLPADGDILEYEKFLISICRQEGMKDSDAIELLEDLRDALYEGCGLYGQEFYKIDDAPIDKTLLPEKLFSVRAIKSHSTCTSYYRKKQSNLNACLACKRSPSYANKYINEELSILRYMIESKENCSHLIDDLLGEKEFAFLSVYDVLLDQRSDKTCFLPVNQWIYKIYSEKWSSIFMFSDRQKGLDVAFTAFREMLNVEKGLKGLPIEYFTNEKWAFALFDRALKRIAAADLMKEPGLLPLIEEISAWQKEREKSIALDAVALPEERSIFIPDYTIKPVKGKKQIISKKKTEGASKDGAAPKEKPVQLSFVDLIEKGNDMLKEWQAESDNLVDKPVNDSLDASEDISEVNLFNTSKKLLVEESDKYDYEKPLSDNFGFVDDFVPSMTDSISESTEEVSTSELPSDEVTKAELKDADSSNNANTESAEEVSSSENAARNEDGLVESHVSPSFDEEKPDGQPIKNKQPAHPLEDSTFDDGLPYKELPSLVDSSFNMEFFITDKELQAFKPINGNLIELSFLQDAALRDGAMAVEAVNTPNGPCLLIYVHARKKYYKTTLSAGGDLNVISYLFRRSSIMKICYQPYLLYSYCYAKGIRIKGVYSLLTHYKYIHPATSVAGVRDLLCASVNVNREDARRKLSETKNLLFDCMYYYKKIFSLQRELEKDLPAHIIEQMEEWDQALGYSYRLGGCMKSSARLFTKLNPLRFEFNNSEYLKTKNDVLYNGYFATYEYPVKTKHAMNIAMRFLCNMSKEGYFGMNNIQLVSLAKNRLVFFIEESEFDYLDSVIGVKLRNQAKQFGVNKLKITVLYEYHRRKGANNSSAIACGQ